MTTSPRSDVDVVVLDVDGGAMLEECLASIERQSMTPSRVIVWDNGSRDPVETRLTADANVEVFRSDSNLGFAAGVNAALRESSGRHVALVNNDVTLDPQWLETLVGEMDEDDRVAGVQSVVLRTDGLVDGAGIDISDGTFRQAGHGEAADRLSGSPWGVSATAAIFRVKALRDVARGDEIFDERLFAYYEDVELCARLLEAGWKLRVVRKALATHRGSSSAVVLKGDALRLRVRNRWVVHRLHGNVGSAWALLREDITHVIRALFSGRVGEAVLRVRSSFEGWKAHT